MNHFLGWVVIIVFFLSLVSAFFFLKQSTSGAEPGFALAAGKVASSTTTEPTLPPPNVPEGYKEYRNEKFGISLYYPKEFAPKEFEDRGPELTVLFQQGEGQPGFQIYAAPIDGSQITPERFLRDAPSGIRQEPIDMSVDGASAVRFYGFDAKVGKTSEVWFIKDRLLYEVSTYKELSGWLVEMMQSWRFVSSTNRVL